ncbi:MAG: WS/DGAT domain-containing protein [Nocardioides sp.]
MAASSAPFPARVPIPAADQTWLHMDRPNNLMHVHSLMWLEREPDWADLQAVLRDRVLDRFPVFRRRATLVDGHWMWEDYDAFDIARHIHRLELPEPRDVATLQAYISRRFSAPFPDDLPLWDMTVLPDVVGFDDEPRTVVFSRFHHALADGIRLVQLLLSMCDALETDVLPPHVGRDGHGLLESGTAAVRRGVADAVDVAKGLAAGAMAIPRAVVHLAPTAFEQGLDLLVHPHKILDAMESVGSLHNQSVNTVSEVTRLLAAGRSAHTSWSGTPGVDKAVAWVTGLDLGGVREVGREHGATVNDVLLAVISRALSRYLAEREALVEEIHWLVPVSLQPLDSNLPEALGNHFSLVFLPMPLGIDDPADLIGAVHARMTRLKESAEPVVSFGLQWLVAESPAAVSVRLTNLFANKAVGVLTNVPGPKSAMTFAGVPVSGVMGWAPTSGDQPLSLAIFSYHGKVNLCIAADARLIPDANAIADLISEEFDALVGDRD